MDWAKTHHERSSRTSAEAAGWPREGGDQVEAGWPGRLKQLKNRRWRDFSWLTARALLDSANDQIAKLIHDLVNDRRARWTAAQRAAGVLDLVIHDHRDARGCLILGDPGEADGSQYAVIAPMLEVDRDLGSDFMVVLSDVIYPAGDVNDYVNGFYEAYREYTKPIFALPGNHDWYDGLNGFMFHFCGVEALPPTAVSSIELLGARARGRTAVAQGRPARPDASPRPPDSSRRARGAGSAGAVLGDGHRRRAADRDRHRASRAPRPRAGRVADPCLASSNQPKVLLTGKPLWVGGEYKPTEIEWGEDSRAPDIDWAPPGPRIARSRRSTTSCATNRSATWRQSAATSTTTSGRPCGGTGRGARIEYLVAGGSGAYMSPTHTIGKVGEPLPKSKCEPPTAVQPLTDADFRCYPTRGDSLAYYSDWFGKRVIKGRFRALALLGVAMAAIGILAWAGDIAHGWAAVLVATVLGAVLTPAVPAVVGWAAHKLSARGYRTVGALLAAPLALIGLYAAARLVDDWVPIAMLVGAGTLLGPIALVLLGYYGFSSERQLKRDLVSCTAVVAVVVLALQRHASLAVDLLTVTLAVTAGAVLLLAVGRARQFFTDRPEDTSERVAKLATGVEERIEKARREPKQWVTFNVVIYSVVPAALVVVYWEVAEVRFVPVAVAGIALTVSALLFAVIALGGGRALKDLRDGGPLDPDEALSYLHHLGIRETLPDPQDPSRPARVGDFSDRTVRICNLLLPAARGPRKWLTSRLTEIGNADEPPMFKSFLSLAVEEGELVITCYGVPGWKDHETDVPVEDRVRIPLSPVP